MVIRLHPWTVALTRLVHLRRASAFAFSSDTDRALFIRPVQFHFAANARLNRRRPSPDLVFGIRDVPFRPGGMLTRTFVFTLYFLGFANSTGIKRPWLTSFHAPTFDCPCTSVSGSGEHLQTARCGYELVQQPFFFLFSYFDIVPK